MIRRLAVVLLLLTGAHTLAAQDARLTKRFSPADVARLQSPIDSAALDKLPTEPLILRALEGKAKGVPLDRIVDALGRLRLALRDARGALGPDTDGAELAIAATALQSGIPSIRLASLHKLRGSRSISAPVGAYLDLVARGAGPDKAWTEIELLARNKAADGAFVRLAALPVPPSLMVPENR